MDSERFNVWLQLAGMTGIIASLIFVGLQLKQSQDIAIATQYAERADAAREIWQFQLELPENVIRLGIQHREHAKSDSDYSDEWSDEMVGRWVVNSRVILSSWDNNHFQYSSGFMTEDAWEMYARRISLGCRAGGSTRIYVKNHGDLFRPAFSEFCLKTNDNDN